MNLFILITKIIESGVFDRLNYHLMPQFRESSCFVDQLPKWRQGMASILNLSLRVIQLFSKIEGPCPYRDSPEAY